MNTKTIRVEMNTAIPESERFAIIEGSRIEHLIEYHQKEVIFFYDRVTKVYTYLYKEPNKDSSLLPIEIDLQDHFLKGDDVFGVEPTPISEWKLVPANECLYSMLKTAMMIDADHGHRQAEDDNRYLFTSAYAYFSTAYNFESGERQHQCLEESPLMELDYDFVTRADEFEFSNWMNECENCDPDELENYEEREEHWKKYFESRSIQLHNSKFVYVSPSKKTQHKGKVVSVAYPDGFDIYKKLREAMPDLLIITADQWDSEDAIIRFDTPEQEKAMNKFVYAYHGLDNQYLEPET